MTKEELEKDAEEYLRTLRVAGITMYNHCDVERAYIHSAELREKRIVELEKENKELKIVKIPQLERKIASIRGAHSADFRKLKARREQVERLKKENAELKRERKRLNDNYHYWNIKACYIDQELYDTKQQLTKAKELIKTFLLIADNKVSQMEFQLCVADAKQFLKEE